MKERRVRVPRFVLVVGAVLGAAFVSGRARALYVPPPETFITHPDERKVTLPIGSGTLAEVQAQIDAARYADPEAVLVIQLSGDYEVLDTPLGLPGKSCLVLSGTLRAAAGATAPALVSIADQSRVSISGGTLDGAGLSLHGIQVTSSSKVNIDGVRVRNTGQAGIAFAGKGTTVWDGGSTITRSEVSGAGAAGIRVESSTRVVILDSYLHDNAGAGIELAPSAHHGSVVNNRAERNAVGIRVEGRDNAVSDNTVNANARGLVLGTASALNSTLQNIVADNTEVGIDLDGSSNLVYSNTLLGNARDFASAGATNYVVPDTRPLDDTSNRYFYPPTIGNRHSDPHIVHGKGRLDVHVSGTALADVQAIYDGARAGSPDDFIVLHMTGAFTHEGVGLRLGSYTAVILDGTIDVVSGPGPPLKGAAGSQFLSISGGVIDGHNFVMEGINIDIGTMVLLDRVTVNNFGHKTPRSGSNSIHLTHGTGFSIVRGCRVDVSGGRAIWTQHSSSRYIVVGNHSSNANMDGIDFDSHTANSLAKDNLCEDNVRYGIFIEEGAQRNKTYNNVARRNHIALNYVANATGPTRWNTDFGNRFIANNHGLRVLGGVTNRTDENFSFNNVLQDQVADSIRVQGDVRNNHFANNVVLGNPTLFLTSTEYPSFFNSPAAAAAPTLPTPIATPTPTPTPTGTPTPIPTPRATPRPTPRPIFYEAEKIPFVTSGPNWFTLTEAGASGGKLIQMASPPATIGDWIEFTLADVPRGTYDLVLKYKTNPNRAIHNLALDGVLINGTLDQYLTGAGTYPEKNFGTVRIEAGEHKVRLTAVGKRPASGSYSITADRFALVPDAKAPTIVIPGDLTAEATGPEGAIVSFVATAVDDKDGNVPVTLAPPSGSLFPLGTTTVEASAQDFAGNKATKTFKVTVEDTTPPTLELPAEVVVEAQSAAGAAAAFEAIAHDLVDGPVPVTFDIPPGSTFPLGKTIVTATATDIAENTATGTFAVIVQDTTAPVIERIAASPAVIGPPNHRMVPVDVAVQVREAVDLAPVTRIVSVESSEPEDGAGDGHTAPDWRISGELSLELRAERAGGGAGRVYAIAVESRDRFGNTGRATVTVSVPHDSAP